MNRPVTDTELTRAQKESGWSETRVRVLTSLWNAGISASECASLLGSVTRNAVISKVTRAGLAAPGRVHPKPCNGHAACPREKPARTSRARTPGPAPKRDEPLPPKIDDFAIPASQRRSLVQLTADCCHWPVGDPLEPDFFFCGAPARQGGPYCSGHHARAVEPRTGRRPIP
ncbi:GcrA family cell cycle regulator [Nitrobacter winogradskyi]|uniref:GcrA cell cycle regulator n=2 Tax=Nitrobacter winogradskyi TaxID=913 RepID=A0ACC6AH29_NITWI|nr:GcrA family cell cycle regulator [Nitrobacter winogradskyi]MCP1998813.1 GcrA cell cycle regulator [Nitrobacter winogradskyi]GEC14265.1 hypothetical protein NWI01_01570 [Nitrobacter winogradskyi]